MTAEEAQAIKVKELRKLLDRVVDLTLELGGNTGDPVLDSVIARLPLHLRFIS